MGDARTRFLAEVMRAGLPTGPGPGDPVTDADLGPLPPAARRYLRFMRVVGRPRDWAFVLAFTGRFRRRPNEAWMPCETWQYNNRLAVARIFRIRVRFGGLIPVVARDTYLDGRGRMLVRLLDRFTIADAAGPEYDLGELVTYLNDAVLIAPSLLLVPEVTWADAGADSFDVTLSDHGRQVAARVVVDAQGAPTDFSTTDRLCADPDNPRRLLRARWTTPISGWAITGDRRLPARAQAVWHLQQGPFVYAVFRPVPGTLTFNPAPAK
jgi:uncharacterized protein DUF6544